MRTTIIVLLVAALAGGCEETADKKPEPTAADKQAPAVDKQAPDVDKQAPVAAATPTTATTATPNVVPTIAVPGATASALPAAGGAEVKIEEMPTKVGDKCQTIDTLLLRFKLIPSGQTPIPARTQKDETLHTEVLAMAGDRVQKFKVHYVVKNERETMNGKAKSKEVSPLQGNTYLIWKDKDEVEMSAEDGKPVSDKEQAELKKAWKNRFRDYDPLEEIIHGRTWKPGDKITLTPEQIKAINDNEELEAKSGSIMLVGVDGKIASFEIDMEVTQTAKGTLSMTVKMLAKVDSTTGRTDELTMNGTMTGTMTGKMSSMAIEGTLVGAKKFSY